MKKLTFNELALIYHNDRSDRNFEVLYQELRKIGSVARNGLTVEIDDYESITTDIAMRLHKNFDKIFTENKSIFSYCFVSFKTKYFSLLKKYNKRVLESDMYYGDGDEQYNGFEKLIYDRTEAEEEPELFDVLHASKELQVEEFYKIIDEHFPNDREMMRDLFKLREEEEVGNSSVFTSPEKIGLKYGIANRTTISAKRTRALIKIKEILAKKVEASKCFDGDRIDGDVMVGKDVVTFENSKIVGSKKIQANGDIVFKTAHEEGWLETRTTGEGIKISEGIRTHDGKRSGFWTFFQENGKLDSRMNYNHPQLPFCTFDSNGFGVEMGKLRK